MSLAYGKNQFLNRPKDPKTNYSRFIAQYNAQSLRNIFETNFVLKKKNLEKKAKKILKVFFAHCTFYLYGPKIIFFSDITKKNTNK